MEGSAKGVSGWTLGATPAFAASGQASAHGKSLAAAARMSFKVILESGLAACPVFTCPPPFLQPQHSPSQHIFVGRQKPNSLTMGKMLQWTSAAMQYLLACKGQSLVCAGKKETFKAHLSLLLNCSKMPLSSSPKLSLFTSEQAEPPPMLLLELLLCWTDGSSP